MAGLSMTELPWGGGSAMDNPAICGCSCFIYVWGALVTALFIIINVIFRLIEFLRPHRGILADSNSTVGSPKFGQKITDNYV